LGYKLLSVTIIHNNHALGDSEVEKKKKTQEKKEKLSLRDRDGFLKKKRKYG